MDESISRIGIPIEVLLLSFSLMSLVMVASIVIWRRSIAMRRTIIGCMLVEYAFLVIYSTIISRSPIYENCIHLMPFWNYDAIFAGVHNDCLEVLLNILMYIPVGLLLPLCLRRATLKRALLLSVVSSFMIELAQLLSRRGTFESDDIIHNAVGCAIGWCVVWGMRKYNATLD